MHAIDATSSRLPQHPTCDALARLRDALEDADFATGFAPMADDDDLNGKPLRADVLYSKYLRALVDDLNADLIPDIDLATARGHAEIARAEAMHGHDYYVTRCRRAEAQALYSRAVTIWSAINQKISPRPAIHSPSLTDTAIVRRFPRRKASVRSV